MAIRHGRRNNSNSNSRREEKVNFGCKRHLTCLCNHRLGDNRGLLAIYDPTELDDTIQQGDLEEMNLCALRDMLEDIPENDEELIDVKERIFVPDFMSYLVNGDVTDIVTMKRKLNGEELDQDIIDLIDEVDTMLRSKSRNVNVRLYTYQPQDMKDASIAWSKEIFNDYIDNLGKGSKTAKTEKKVKSLEEQLAEALANDDMAKANIIMEFQRQQAVISKNNTESDNNANNEAQA